MDGKFESDTELYDLHLKAVEWHQNKAKGLRQDPNFLPLIEEMRNSMTVIEKKRMAKLDFGAT